VSRLVTIEVEYDKVEWFEWRTMLEPWETMYDITRLGECGLTNIDYKTLLF
jgi:hypothetical protein